MIFNEHAEKNIIDEFCEHPKIKRGKVWCRICGKEETIDPKYCMKNGWNKCCGETMTIDSPLEQKWVSKECDTAIRKN
jgi:hypothetical protein